MQKLPADDDVIMWAKDLLGMHAPGDTMRAKSDDQDFNRVHSPSKSVDHVVPTLPTNASEATPPPLGGAPFYEDPLFNGAHDAEFVWHAGEQCWWVTYLQIRFNLGC